METFAMIVGIILSAGESRRMGAPKQLLPWGDSILLQRVIEVAAASRLDEVILILGHRAEEIAACVTLPPKTRIAINPDFTNGMGSSFQCGILNAPPDAEAFMLLLGDQPLLETAVIDALIADFGRGRQGITIPVFNSRRGHPVIFAAKYREELLAMGDGGARMVIAAHAGEIFEVPVALANILTDMDTPEQYRQALKMAGQGHF